MVNQKIENSLDNQPTPQTYATRPHTARNHLAPVWHEKWCFFFNASTPTPPVSTTQQATELMAHSINSIFTHILHPPKWEINSAQAASKFTNECFIREGKLHQEVEFPALQHAHGLAGDDPPQKPGICFTNVFEFSRKSRPPKERERSLLPSTCWTLQHQPPS